MAEGKVQFYPEACAVVIRSGAGSKEFVPVDAVRSLAETLQESFQKQLAESIFSPSPFPSLPAERVSRLRRLHRWFVSRWYGLRSRLALAICPELESEEE